MNKFAFKTIVAAAAFVAVGAASAANVTVNVGDTVDGYTLESGFGGLEFSKSLVGALNASGTVVEAIAPATATAVKNAAGTKYVSVGVTDAQVTSINVDDVTLDVTDAYTLGGTLQTTVNDDFATTGGSLSVTNLHVDLTNKKVFADIVGANGVGSLNGFYLWDITSITGATTVAAGTSLTTLSGLKITTDGFAKFSQALGLTSIGQGALAGVTDFGTITSSITASAVPAVPEPSSYALALAGLAAVGVFARRRAAK